MVTGKDIARSALEIANLQPQAGYIYGTSGQTWTADDQARITVEKADDPNYAYSIRYGGQWVGHKVYDCSGLTMRVYAQHGIKLAHGSNSQHRACTSTGAAAGAPAGALVFKVRNGSDYHHVGIHMGDGKVVEAQGARTGVIISDLSSWAEYGLVAGVDYGAQPGPAPDPDPQPQPDPGPGEYMTVDVPNDGTVNLRDRPDGQRIGTLCEGQTVRVVSTQGDWSECEIPRTVWIMSKYLRR